MRERCITAGGRDGSLRLWKIVEESHLMFTGHKFVFVTSMNFTSFTFCFLFYYRILSEVQSIALH
jgi:hypothetical protein